MRTWEIISLLFTLLLFAAVGSVNAAPVSARSTASGPGDPAEVAEVAAFA